eukprot:2439724-Pleurochrysis_carterae.AAC.1
MTISARRNNHHQRTSRNNHQQRTRRNNRHLHLAMRTPCHEPPVASAMASSSPFKRRATATT